MLTALKMNLFFAMILATNAYALSITERTELTLKAEQEGVEECVENFLIAAPSEIEKPYWDDLCKHFGISAEPAHEILLKLTLPQGLKIQRDQADPTNRSVAVFDDKGKRILTSFVKKRISGKYSEESCYTYVLWENP